MPARPRPAREIALTAAALAWGLTPSGAALRGDGPNPGDAERMERGYYEHVIDSGRRLGDPAPPHAATANDPFRYGRLALAVDDLREYALKPNLITTHKGASWTTNSLGLRDREYAPSKPPGTVRVALVGDSIGAGWGVDDGLGFEPRLERSLDARSRESGGPAVEVLNFSVPGHAPGQRWEDFRRAGRGLGIDLVIYQATPAEPGWDERRLRALLARGVGWEAPQYRDALRAAGARPGCDPEALSHLLKPHRWEILENVYRSIADECRAREVPALWLLIPRVGRPVDRADRGRLVATARRAGFSATIDLSDAFDGLDPAALAIATDDHHPNAEGHARLARRLEAALAARPEWLRPSPRDAEARTR